MFLLGFDAKSIMPTISICTAAFDPNQNRSLKENLRFVISNSWCKNFCLSYNVELRFRPWQRHRGMATSIAVKYKDTQLAVYHGSNTRGFYATQQMWANIERATFHEMMVDSCRHPQAFVVVIAFLVEAIPSWIPFLQYVSCPLMTFAHSSSFVLTRLIPIIPSSSAYIPKLRVPFMASCIRGLGTAAFSYSFWTINSFVHFKCKWVIFLLRIAVVLRQKHVLQFY